MQVDPNDVQMRRISKKHLEVAKEYENLIELFFKESDEQHLLSSEYLPE